MNYTFFTRADFMSFFRDTEKLNELSVDDRLEVFHSILAGSSDFSAKLLNEIVGRLWGRASENVCGG